MLLIKLSVKELQAIDAVLNCCFDETKFKMVINYQGKLVSGDFLQYDENNSIVSPIVAYNGIHFAEEHNNEYLFYALTLYISQKYIDSKKAHTVSKNPELFLNWIIDVFQEFLKIHPENQFKSYERHQMYKVEFLESKVTLDYMYLDPTIKYELVSVI